MDRGGRSLDDPDPDPDPDLAAAPKAVRLLKDRGALGDEMSDVAVQAVRPQMIDEVLPGYVAYIAETATRC